MQVASGVDFAGNEVGLDQESSAYAALSSLDEPKIFLGLIFH